MASPRSFKQINTASRELQLLQDNIERAVGEVINMALLNGRLVTAVDLASGNTSVEHKLDRVPQGYIITDKNNAAAIYTASKDNKYLVLNSSAACTISFWIF
jgi:heptaprenylglyceryl phosphate synthase